MKINLFPAAALLITVACGGGDDGVIVRDDAAVYQPRDAIEQCVLSKFEGDPTQSCIAEWGCPGYGALTLACGTSSSTGPVCICLRGEEPPTTVMMVPSTCTDPAVLTSFARTNCGWSWL